MGRVFIVASASGPTIGRMSNAALEAPRESIVQDGFEHCIWGSRFLVIIAVAASILAAIGLFVVAALDNVTLIREMVRYLGAAAEQRDALKYVLLTEVAENIDAFLFATILLVFALGLYELFIARIHVAERAKFADQLLFITSIDDLKNRLSKIIFLILIVRYFEFALKLSPTTITETLQFACGIVLIAVAIFLTSRK